MRALSAPRRQASDSARRAVTIVEEPATAKDARMPTRPVATSSIEPGSGVADTAAGRRNAAAAVLIGIESAAPDGPPNGSGAGLV
jgi:hypothetical protein